MGQLPLDDGLLCARHRLGDVSRKPLYPLGGEEPEQVLRLRLIVAPLAVVVALASPEIRSGDSAYARFCAGPPIEFGS